MSYHATGQMGQIPTNGDYRHGGDGVFGQLIPPEVLYASPPTWNDNGLRRITDQSRVTFVWSINATTNLDVTMGASVEHNLDYYDTLLLRAVAGVGDTWLSLFVDQGYVVMFLPKGVKELGPTLDFYISKDTNFIADNAAYALNHLIIIDGPEPIIQLAKGILAGTTGGEQCPAGTTGTWPVCIPTQLPLPGELPGLPGELPSELPSTGCPPGEIGFPPFCFAVPGVPGVPGVAPPAVEIEPPEEVVVEPPPPGVPPPPPPTLEKEKAAAAAVAGAPTWLLPVLIGVGVVGLGLMAYGATKRRG